MNDTDANTGDETDHEVVIVGGGPAGCSAGVFTARYGLDTLIFDRGRSSIRRCAYLENYPGFPGGIDIETFYGLLHDHAEAAGCELVADLVESVETTDGGDDDGGGGDGDGGDDSGGFVVGTQDGRCVRAERVVAATRYGGEYLRPLDEGAMFETHEHDGETRERFDRSYADADGRTPIDGLYVASPSEQADRQAIIAAGHGAQVARAVVEDRRRAVGYWDAVAEHYDWVRKEAELSGEWADRERWRAYFEDSLAPEDHDRSGVEFEWLRERYIDDRFEQYVTEDAVERRTERGARALLERIDDEHIHAYLDDTASTAETTGSTTMTGSTTDDG